MTKDDFSQFIKTIGNYYNLEKIVDEDRFILWFNFVSRIDASYLPEIKDYIFDNFDSLPRNLPKAMYKAYYELSEQHQHERRANFISMPCKDCSGIGILFPYLLNSKTLRYIKVTMACGSCENWKQHWDSLEPTTGRTIKHANTQIIIPRKTKAEIESMEYFAGFDGLIETIHKVKELNRKMGEMNRR